MPIPTRFAPFLAAIAVVAAGSVAGADPVVPVPTAPATPLHAPAVLPAGRVASMTPAASAAWLPPSATYLRIYILDGLDPVGLAGVESLAERLRRAGFPRVEVDGWYSWWFVEREIRSTHAADPNARFAVIGYSTGSYAARMMVNRLTRAGIPVSVLGYVGGDFLSDSPRTRMPGVGQVVNVTGDGFLLTGRNLFYNGTDLTGARNVRLNGTWHYELPTHPTTFDTLFAALAAAE